MTAHVVTKEMGYTHREFLRLLPKALGSDDYTVDGREIRFTDGERQLDISLSEEGERRIALVRIPMTEVQLSFTGYDQPGIEAALKLFWRAYQKGGG